MRALLCMAIVMSTSGEIRLLTKGKPMGYNYAAYIVWALVFIGLPIGGIVLGAMQMKKKSAGLLIAEAIVFAVLALATAVLMPNPTGSVFPAIAALVLIVMLIVHRKKHAPAKAEKDSTRLSFSEVASIWNQAFKEEFGEESVYLTMKSKAETGSAQDALAFAKRLKEDNCGRPMPEGLSASIAYFREIVDVLESVSFLSEAKLELAYTYLGLADVFQKVSDKDGFLEYADKGIDYFRRALNTGEFEDHREDYEIIRKNIEEMKDKL